MTCDVCERDIGHEDERRPEAHFEVRRLPNLGTIDAYEPPMLLCSLNCLRAYAAGIPSPPRRPRRRRTAAVPTRAPR